MSKLNVPSAPIPGSATSTKRYLNRSVIFCSIILVLILSNAYFIVTNKYWRFYRNAAFANISSDNFKSGITCYELIESGMQKADESDEIYAAIEEDSTKFGLKLQSDKLTRYNYLEVNPIDNEYKIITMDGNEIDATREGPTYFEKFTLFLDTGQYTIVGRSFPGGGGTYMRHGNCSV